MLQRNVTTSGSYLAKARVSPAGGGADETLADIARAALAVASTQEPGRVTLATAEDIAAGTNATRAVTPAGLAAQKHVKRSDVTFEALNDNGDVGGGATQLAPGNHTHPEYQTTAAAKGAAGDAFALSHSGSGGAAHANATVAVAGFLSPADKAKLDGIETRATADQTGAEIVAAINSQLGSSSWQLAGGSGSSAWGSISGAIAEQTDLAAALGRKSEADHDHPAANWVEEYDYGTNGFITGEEKRKLTLIEEGAQVNTWRISNAKNNALPGTVYGWSGNQATYEGLTPDSSTLYFVTGTAGTTLPTAGRLIVPIAGNGDVDLIDVNFAGTLTRVTDVRLLGGTAPAARVTLKINGRAVSGVSVAATATASPDHDATGGNALKARDVLKATIAAASGSPTALDITIHMEKDL